MMNEKRPVLASLGLLSSATQSDSSRTFVRSNFG